MPAGLFPTSLPPAPSPGAAIASSSPHFPKTLGYKPSLGLAPTCFTSSLANWCFQYSSAQLRVCTSSPARLTARRREPGEMKGRNRQVHPEYSSMPEQEQARQRIKEELEPVPCLSSASSMTQSQPLALQRQARLAEPWEASLLKTLPGLVSLSWQRCYLAQLFLLPDPVASIPVCLLSTDVAPALGACGHGFIQQGLSFVMVTPFFSTKSREVDQIRLKLHRFGSSKDEQSGSTKPSWQRLGWRQVRALELCH